MAVTVIFLSGQIFFSPRPPFWLATALGMDVDNFYCIVHCEISSRKNYSIEKKSLKILKKLHQWMGQMQVLLCNGTPPRASGPPSLVPVCKNSTEKLIKIMKFKVKKKRSLCNFQHCAICVIGVIIWLRRKLCRKFQYKCLLNRRASFGQFTVMPM